MSPEIQELADLWEILEYAACLLGGSLLGILIGYWISRLIDRWRYR